MRHLPTGSVPVAADTIACVHCGWTTTPLRWDYGGNAWNIGGASLQRHLALGVAPSMLSVDSIRCHRPWASHSRYRLYAVSHLPNPPGISRREASVRTTHSMPLRIARWWWRGPRSAVSAVVAAAVLSPSPLTPMVAGPRSLLVQAPTPIRHRTTVAPAVPPAPAAPGSGQRSSWGSSARMRGPPAPASA